MNHSSVCIKHLSIVILAAVMHSCTTSNKKEEALEKRMDDLEKSLAGTYRPGLGEFMSGIQVHHEKLWFAGINKNWELAEFEVDEIKEALENIKIYSADRKETKEIVMIDQPMDSLTAAIDLKDEQLFRNNFRMFTNACNACHLATDHGFNIIKIPEIPPFSNQDFKPRKELNLKGTN